ncbi:UvrD-helicase domain-containing protein [Cryobacterium sp. Y50]|uniref:HelD family protein n=1 Tax=Cryobacterium sp. Y50 TaxID=2048286 RepID=UPI000CE54A8D|nr:UvrD-helicase domain-containing protein [Cryobacterium sp. Y50]
MTDATATDKTGEHRYLAKTLELVESAHANLIDSIDRSELAMDEQKREMWEHQRDMDHAEKANARMQMATSVAIGDSAVKSRDSLERLRNSPYFGRVDFQHADTASAKSYYIGVRGFWDPETQDLRVHDWRAPVSSLYYDYEAGPATFDAPEGVAEGEIVGKRQYKIEAGHLQYSLESSINIGDEVLQRELSESADDKMRNIVATIQREQNAVIRNETAKVLILQGVAGSGKTSIALHRLAFLLYRFKDTLSSSNVMILSPNKVFADYIADVLPELGEEQVAEIDLDRIAERFLSKVVQHQTFSEQVSGVLDNVDHDAADRMRAKATPEFVGELHEWIAVRADDFTPDKVVQHSERVSADWVADAFASGHTSPIYTRLDQVADSAIHLMKQRVLDRHGKWSAVDSTSVRKQVRAMFPFKDAFALYRAFYNEPSRRAHFTMLDHKRIEHSDVAPLIYTLITTARHDGFEDIHHLLVDEMQDYTPIQYAVLRKLFACNMTILGDSNQSVNPFSSSNLETIFSIFPEADCLELCKSYRSTTEITEFAQNISRNDKLIPIERHGPPPQLLACETPQDETARVLEIIATHKRSEYRSLGIVCKTLDQAERLYRAVAAEGIELTLLDYDSKTFTGGIIITSAHIAKGLEFDVVIVPHVDDATYTTDIDRSMLYIACTRAMHQLHLTHTGTASTFLPSAPELARSVKISV